ncbi:hypothetical protein RJ641_006884 [Dillenia turbinata]|uniref:EamA domain-containing protein n=1 Tax=Dillenia turbinata TaxID=194707 RepID=A0AAN8ZC82_9MAGN
MIGNVVAITGAFVAILYQGPRLIRIVGSLVIVTGTTAVIWGKCKEEVVEEGQIDEASSSSNVQFSRPGDEDAPASSSSNVPCFRPGDEDVQE